MWDPKHNIVGTKEKNWMEHAHIENGTRSTSKKSTWRNPWREEKPRSTDEKMERRTGINRPPAYKKRRRRRDADDVKKTCDDKKKSNRKLNPFHLGICFNLFPLTQQATSLFVIWTCKNIVQRNNNALLKGRITSFSKLICHYVFKERLEISR